MTNTPTQETQEPPKQLEFNFDLVNLHKKVLAKKNIFQLRRLYAKAAKLKKVKAKLNQYSDYTVGQYNTALCNEIEKHVSYRLRIGKSFHERYKKQSTESSSKDSKSTT